MVSSWRCYVETENSTKYSLGRGGSLGWALRLNVMAQLTHTFGFLTGISMCPAASCSCYHAFLTVMNCILLTAAAEFYFLQFWRLGVQIKVWPTSLISNKDLPLHSQWLRMCILQRGELYSHAALNVSLLALL